MRLSFWGKFPCSSMNSCDNFIFNFIFIFFFFFSRRLTFHSSSRDTSTQLPVFSCCRRKLLCSGYWVSPGLNFLQGNLHLTCGCPHSYRWKKPFCYLSLANRGVTGDAPAATLQLQRKSRVCNPPFSRRSSSFSRGIYVRILQLLYLHFKKS